MLSLTPITSSLSTSFPNRNEDEEVGSVRTRTGDVEAEKREFENRNEGGEGSK
jgi:hypothetical protein